MKNKLYFILFAVLMVLAFGVSAVMAEPLADRWSWNWDAWNYGDCYSTTYCGYGWGYNNWCQASYSKPYQAEFVTDVTYPDGSHVNPGQSFVKTWRLRNIGNCNWTPAMSLVFVSGNNMGAPTRVNIPYNVAPGQTVDISVTMHAPTNIASFSGSWMLMAPDGSTFGVGCNGNVAIWATVTTGNAYASPSCYCSGQYDCPCGGAGAYNYSSTGARAGKNPYCNNKVRTVSDITIPDGTVMAPGTVFRKTWRMKNGGTCVWDENYLMVYAGGDNLGGAEFVRVNSANIVRGNEYTGARSAHKVYPGDYIEISVDLKAPDTPGAYQAYYKLRDNMGYEFGFGSYAAEPFWVKITVSDSVSKSAGSTEPLPAGNATVVEPGKEAAKPSGETSIVPVTTVRPENACGEQSISLEKTDTGYKLNWSLENAGTKDWDSSYKLVLSDSSDLLKADGSEFALPETKAGEFAKLSINVSKEDGAVTEGDEKLWMEFYLTDGNAQFCKFYFEIPTA